jgi:hypothetical protein
MALAGLLHLLPALPPPPRRGRCCWRRWAGVVLVLECAADAGFLAAGRRVETEYRRELLAALPRLPGEYLRSRLDAHAIAVLAQGPAGSGAGGRRHGPTLAVLDQGSQGACPPQVQTFRRKTDAQAWIAKTEAALRECQRLPTGEAKSRTVKDLISRYRAEVVPAYSQREQVQRPGKLAWREAQLDRVPALELTTAQVAECRGKLARGEVRACGATAA